MPKDGPVFDEETFDGYVKEFLLPYYQALAHIETTQDQINRIEKIRNRQPLKIRTITIPMVRDFD